MMKRISTIMGIFFLITLISSIQLTTALAQSDIMDAFKGKKLSSLCTTALVAATILLLEH